MKTLLLVVAANGESPVYYTKRIIVITFESSKVCSNPSMHNVRVVGGRGDFVNGFGCVKLIPSARLHLLFTFTTCTCTGPCRVEDGDFRMVTALPSKTEDRNEGSTEMLL